MQNRYLYILIFCLGFCLHVLNFHQLNFLGIFENPIMLSQFLLILGLFSALYRAFKKQPNSRLIIGTRTILVLFLALQFYLGYWSCQIYREKAILAEYQELTGCDQALARFEVDKMKKEIKYFHFGLGPDENLNQLLSEEYDISVYHLGCVATHKLECYNEAVEKLIGKSFKK